MAKKKAAAKKTPTAPAPAPVAEMNPGMAGMMPQMGQPQMANPMMQMAQMMQMMMGGGAGPAMMDPSAIPFSSGQVVEDDDAGLNEDFIRPALLDNLVKKQEAVELGCVGGLYEYRAGIFFDGAQTQGAV